MIKATVWQRWDAHKTVKVNGKMQRDTFFLRRPLRWMRQAIAFRQETVIFFVFSVLFGRAIVFEVMMPFAIAFWTTTLLLYPRHTKRVMVGLALGGLFVQPASLIALGAKLVVVFVLVQGLRRRVRLTQRMLACCVGGGVLVVEGVLAGLTAPVTAYLVLMVGLEALLSAILTGLFCLTLPLVLRVQSHERLKHEQIICLVLLASALLIGLAHLHIGGVSIVHVLTRYMTLMMGFMGGVSVGASAGVLMGVVLSLTGLEELSQVGLLAIAGLLAGLCKPSGRWASLGGMVLGALLLTMHAPHATAATDSVLETLLAAGLFLLTPKKVQDWLGRYIPHSPQHVHTHQQYAQRLRDSTANRVVQFAEVFQQLAHSFGVMLERTHAQQSDGHAQVVMQQMMSRTCATCYRKHTCWTVKTADTVEWLSDVLQVVAKQEDAWRRVKQRQWHLRCHKTDQVISILKKQSRTSRRDAHWIKQIQDSRKLVSEQLAGVAKVMGDLAGEIRREEQHADISEEQMMRRLGQEGIRVHAIQVISLDPGHIEIEMAHRLQPAFGECRKLIAPVLSQWLQETIVVKHEMADTPALGYTTTRFHSAKRYEIQTGIARVAKGGAWLSGDSFATVELENGKFILALSDGMGNGQRAQEESSAALSILQQLLQSGMEQSLALKSVNAVLTLRSPDDMYATVDLAMINLYDAQTTFMKSGSTPSFIKRHKEVIPITAHNLPIGILQDIEIEPVHCSLQSDDILIMMTDGVYDALGHALNKERAMARLLTEVTTDEPQQFAEALLARTMQLDSGAIDDDMTVVVAKIGSYRPEWAAIPHVRYP
jgi:stage II sporulation protein E